MDCSGDFCQKSFIYRTEVYVPGHKVVKDLIGFMSCSNVSEIYKHTFYIIGRSKNY